MGVVISKGNKIINRGVGSVTEPIKQSIVQTDAGTVANKQQITSTLRTQYPIQEQIVPIPTKPYNNPALPDVHWKEPVLLKALLPLTGNVINDARVVENGGNPSLYICIGNSGSFGEQWILYDPGLSNTIAASANAYNKSVDYTNSLVETVSSQVNDHNELHNIDGGTTNQYYHLTLIDYLDRASKTYVDIQSVASSGNGVSYTNNVSGNLAQYIDIRTSNSNNWNTAYSWGQGLKLDQATPQTIINGAPIFNAGLKSGSDIIFLKGAGRTIGIEDQTSTNQGNGITITAGKGFGSPGYGGQLSLFGGYDAASTPGARILIGGGGWQVGQLDLIAGYGADMYLRGADNTTKPGNNVGGDIYLIGGSGSGSALPGTIKMSAKVNSSVYACFDTFDLQADRTYKFPDKSGTFAMTSDLGSASLTSTYVGFGNGSNIMTGSELLTFNTTGNILQLGAVATSEGNKTGELRFANGTVPYYVGFKASDTTAASVTYILPINKPSSTAFLKSDNNGVLSFDTNTYEAPLIFGSGLTRNVDTITNNLTTGVSGGQILYGGTQSGDNLTVRANTGNVNQGSILFTNTKQVTASDFASVIFSGGVGMKKDLYIAGNLFVGAVQQSTQAYESIFGYNASFGVTLTLSSVLAAGTTPRILAFKTFDSTYKSRWELKTNGDTETGTNVGSNFQLDSYNDDGTLLRNIFTITRASGLITLADGINIALDTTNGTKIGTATTQKLGFFNATPIVQPATYTASSVSIDRTYNASATTITELANVLGTLISDLKALGLIG